MEASSEWTEERKEEDLEDLEEVSAGGEPGIGVLGMDCTSRGKVIASSQLEMGGEKTALCKVAMFAVL